MQIPLGKRVSVHIFLPIMLFLSFFTPSGHIYRRMLLCAVIHEGCHFLAAALCRVRLRRVIVLPYGLCLHLGNSGYTKRAGILLAGPIGSLLFCILFLILGKPDVARLHFLLFFGNLLPALPLDGGYLFRLYLLKKYGLVRARKGSRLMGRCVFLLLLTGGIFFRSAAFFFAASLIFRYTFFLPLRHAPGATPR